MQRRIMLLLVSISIMLLAANTTSFAARARVASSIEGVNIRDLVGDSPATPLAGAENTDYNPLINKSQRIITKQALGFSPKGSMTVGFTYMDYQHNGSMGRQIVVGGGWVHNLWMLLPDASTANRSVEYFAYPLSGSGEVSNPNVEGATGGGYVNIGYTSIDSVPVVIFHNTSGIGTKAGRDSALGDGSFTMFAFPASNCQSIVSGIGPAEGKYVWPILAVDNDGTNAIVHAVSSESPPTANDVQSLIYYRSNNGITASGPTCGYWLDSTDNITPVVAADPNSDKVAVVYIRPKDYAFTAGLQQKNGEVVYRESTDLGNSWGELVNVTKYTGAIHERAYTDCDAMYTEDGCLHIAWNTPTFDSVAGTATTQAAKLRHWDNCSQCIALILDASHFDGAATKNCGVWNNNVCKMNLSECTVGASKLLYVTYTYFKSDQSDSTTTDVSLGGLKNGDICAQVSNTNGITWGPRVNLTNTTTPNCGAGFCKSEHWSSSAMYVTDSLRIQYIEDLDAGGIAQTEGGWTNNPVKNISVGCFSMDSIVTLVATPAELRYPCHTVPNQFRNETITLTNTGNVPGNWSVAINGSFLSLEGSSTGVCNAGCNNTASFVVKITGPPTEGLYQGTIDVTYSLPDKAPQEFFAIPVDLYNFVNFYLPQNASIRTATNRLCFNQASESADSVAGHRFSYFADTSNYLFDGYLILGNDALNLSYSVYDGPFEAVPSPSNPFGYTYAATPEMVCDSTSYTSFRKATGRGVNRDTTIGFTVDWYAPKHADSSDFYVGQFKVYKGSKNPTGSITNLSLAYYTDWDVPSDTNTKNTAGFDATRSFIWTRGSWSSANLSRYAATAAYRNDGNPVIGGWLLDHPTYVYPNLGFENDSLWSIMESLVQGTYRIYTGDPIDVGGGMLIYRDATINGAAHDTLRFVVVLAATRNGGYSGLVSAVEKAQDWLCNHDLARGADICPAIVCGDANGSGSVGLADISYLISYIFIGGPAPVEPSSGDADGSGCVDMSDAIFLINNFFGGGPAPGTSCNVNGCSYSTPANNQVRLACPVVVSSIAPGDSIPLNVHLTSSVSIQGFSLGFSHNSPDLEFSSASRTPILEDFGNWHVYNRPINNRILTGISDYSGATLAPQNDAHVFTLYLKNVTGAQTQCINIDSAFVGPAGKFIYSVTNGGSIAPAYSDCGLQDVNIGEACEDSFRIAPKPWSFANSEGNMWPHSWWQQFNYCTGVSPCQQYCLLCGPSDFPNWELFVSAIGEQQAYFDPPPGNVSFRPSAIAQWEALRGAWTGSCFGFAAASYLFYDNYLQVGTVFPGYNNLTSVPINGDSRKLINKYYLYQFGVEQQQLISNSLTTKTPAQTLTECKAMFIEIPRDDRVLMMFNQTGSGGHAVTAYRCLQDGTDPNHWYLYIFDSNFPADTSKRIDIDLSGNTWSYSGQPDWGGGHGLFLLDPVSSYSAPLILADTAEATAGIRFYFGETDSVELESPAGTVGFTESGVYGSVPGASPIIPADGASTNPYGYVLPTGEWYCRASGVIDGVFTIVDGEKRIFRNGGAKSGIISCYFKADATAPSLTSYGSSPGKGIYDSSFIEIISMAPDSEVSVQISGMELAASESLTVTLTADESIQIDNFGSAVSYDLQVQIVSPTADTVFYTPDVQIDGSTSQLITPDWRPTGDSIVIAVDTSMSGDFDSTVVVVNHNPPQFVCGDANGSGAINISDAVFLINYIFSGGQAPSPVLRGDANCSGGVNISDAVYLINYIFSGGAMPCAACQ